MRGSKGRPKGRKQGARTLIRTSPLGPNAICHFPQKLNTSLKIHQLCLHLWYLFLWFWVPFSSDLPKSAQRGPGPRPKVLKRPENGPQSPQMESKGAQMMPKWDPRGPKWFTNGPRSAPTVHKWNPRVSQWNPQVPQSAEKRHIHTHLTIFFKGRRQCFAHQYKTL